MQYLSWADVQIPLCFVTGLSYAKRAKIVEHYGGTVSSRGFEPAEISVQIQVSRAACMAFELDFNEQVASMRALKPERNTPSGNVTIGGYAVYPELLFALTNVNTTHSSDSASGLSIYACDLILSGVACAKEVTRQRSLEFDPVTVIPVVSLKVRDKKMILQDGNRLSGLITSPAACDVECIMSDDSKKISRKGFVDELINGGGEIEIELPYGKTKYNVISASLNDNILSLSGSIYPESACQAVTMSFRDKDIKDVVGDILKKCGFASSKINISGKIDYFKTTSSPLSALEALQKSAGFVVNCVGNDLTVAWLPSKIDPQKEMSDNVIDDSTNERVAHVIWKDGLHEFDVGDGNGESIEIESSFSSSESSFASHVLDYTRYRYTYIAVEDVIDTELAHHSQVGIRKNDATIPCLIDFFQCDWISGIARYECRHLGV